MGEGTWIFVFAGVAVFLILRDQHRKARRRASLVRDKDGTYVWTDYRGKTRRSKHHPDKPGGDWHSGAEGGDFGDGAGGGE